MFNCYVHILVCSSVDVIFTPPMPTGVHALHRRYSGPKIYEILISCTAILSPRLYRINVLYTYLTYSIVYFASMFELRILLSATTK